MRWRGGRSGGVMWSGGREERGVKREEWRVKAGEEGE